MDNMENMNSGINFRLSRPNLVAAKVIILYSYRSGWKLYLAKFPCLVRFKSNLTVGNCKVFMTTVKH